ncbi:3'-5' exoribonuclease [Candidatus Saccharibacteria bacterium]|nr:3'-5' exoribonuclease [Candidatus Saccharibacteria bacterium]
MLDKNQIYVVVDIENNGPTPGQYSMLAIGATATTQHEEVATFYRTILPIEGASEHADTMKWWGTQPEAWEQVCKDASPADVVMKDFYEWLNALDAEPIFVAHPIAVDYTFVSWYLYKFVGINPFAINKADILLTLDLRSYISGKFGRTLNDSRRSELPEFLTKGMPEHTHNALEDSQGYGVILRNILNSTN